MKNPILAFLLWAISGACFAQSVADISFNTNSWSTPSGSSISGNQLTITGNTGSYIQVQLTVTNINPIPTDLYFIADVSLNNIQDGSQSYQCPKFKIYSGSGSKLQVLNISTYPAGTFTTGIKIANFNKLGLSSVILEFAIQNATGTMTVTNPQLLSSPPTNSYSFPYTVPADPSCSIDIITTQKHAFENDLLSTNSHFVWASYSWGDPEVINVIDNHFPMSNMRFPGGTVGNFYDWTTDGFYNDSWTFSSPSRQAAYNNGFQFGFPGYKDLCVANKASSTLMFNVIEDNVTKSKNRLQDRINQGLNVKWIEMGNENYYNGQNYGNVSSQANYVSFTTSLSSGLKSVDPNVKVAVNIENDNYSSGSWNDTLSQLNYYDAAVMHPYVNTGAFMLNAFSAQEMLSAFKTTQQRIANYSAHFNKPLLFTEWNILSSGTPVNFIQTLGLADMFLAIEKGNQDSIVKQAGIHMLYLSDNYSEATLVYYNNGSMVKTANGVMYEKLFEIFQNKNVFDAVSSSAELETALPAVNAKAVEDGDSIRVYVVNKLPVGSPLNIQVDNSSYSGDYTLETFSIDPNTELTTPFNINDNPWVHTTGSGSITIPAYTLAIASFMNPGVVTSTTGVTQEKQLTIRPNPTDGLLHLDGASGSNWVLMNSLGVTLESGSGTIIDLSSRTAGVYILEIDGKAYRVIRK